jgi:tetratricopeptide (TPR) repeat protein
MQQVFLVGRSLLAALILFGAPRFSPLFAAEKASSQSWSELCAAAEKARKQGDFPAMESNYSQAMEAAEKFGSRDPRFIKTTLQLCEAQMTMRHFEAAENAARKSLAARTAKFKEIEDAQLQLGLGGALFYQEKYSEGLVVFSNSLQIIQRKIGPFHALTCYPLAGMGACQAGLSNYAAADELFAKAIKNASTRTTQVSDSIDGGTQVESLPPDLRHLAAIMDGYGLMQLEAGRYEAAEITLKRSLSFLGNSSKSKARFNPLFNLGALKFRQKDFPAAETYLLQAREVLEKTIGLDNRFGADTMRLLWLSYLGDNKTAEAAAIEAKAKALNEKFPRNLK